MFGGIEHVLIHIVAQPLYTSKKYLFYYSRYDDDYYILLQSKGVFHLYTNIYL